MRLVRDLAVSGLVVFDLESQELVQGLECRFVVGGDEHSGSARGLDDVPVEGVFLLRHDCGARYVDRVDEHGVGEVAFGEHVGDEVEVSANLVAACGVLEVICQDFDCAAVEGESEVMCGLLLREAHDVGSARVHLAGVIVLRETRNAGEECQDDGGDLHVPISGERVAPEGFRG